MGPLIIVLLIAGAGAAPLRRHQDLDDILDDFLQKLYNYHTDTDIYDQMQGDQPDNNNLDDATTANSTNITDYLRTSRNR